MKLITLVEREREREMDLFSQVIIDLKIVISTVPAWVWSVKVCTHSALEKSQIFTVVSPLDVTNLEPLKNIMKCCKDIVYKKQYIHMYK